MRIRGLGVKISWGGGDEGSGLEVGADIPASAGFAGGPVHDDPLAVEVDVLDGDGDGTLRRHVYSVGLPNVYGKFSPRKTRDFLARTWQRASRPS